MRKEVAGVLGQAYADRQWVEEAVAAALWGNEKSPARITRAGLFCGTVALDGPGLGAIHPFRQLTVSPRQTRVVAAGAAGGTDGS